MISQIDMVYEIFSIPIADIAAIGALIFSGYTYLAGSRRWSQSKKSEEINSARELMDRITKKQDRLDEYIDQVYSDPQNYDFGRHLDIMNSVLEEIEYYGLLIENNVNKCKIM